MNIDVQGALQIKDKLPKKTVLIFLKTKTITELKRRIDKREKGKMVKEIIELRLKNAKKESALAKKYDHTVINENNRLKETINQVADIIKKELNP